MTTASDDEEDVEADEVVEDPLGRGETGGEMSNL